MSRIVLAAWLRKLAKHLAVLVCLTIAVKSGGWADYGEAAILGLAITASCLEMAGRFLNRRPRPAERS